MTDRQLRNQLQQARHWYASSRHWGPAHIISLTRSALCGSTFDTRARVRATDLCLKCRAAARKIFKDKGE